MKCEWCHQPIQEDPVRLTFYEGEEFHVHGFCASTIQTELNKVHEEPRKRNLVQYYLKRLSGG